MTMAELALAVQDWGRPSINRPVVDSTGLGGIFDFTFVMNLAPNLGMRLADISESRSADQGFRLGVRQARPGVQADTGTSMGDPISGIFEAMTQLGLKLELLKRPVSVIVIDHADRIPSAN